MHRFIHEAAICCEKILVLKIHFALGNTHIVGKFGGKYSVWNILGNLPTGIVAAELPKVPHILKHCFLVLILFFYTILSSSSCFNHVLVIFLNKISLHIGGDI